MNTTRSDFLIIGGGPVGIQACRMLRAGKPEASVTVLRPEDFSVIYCAIPYVIEGLIEPGAIAKKDELITETGAQLLKIAASKVDLAGHLVTLADGRQIEYGKLIIATGAVPFVPAVPGHNLKNIFTVKTAKDTEIIKTAAENATRVVVIGAGAIGIEQAQAMQALGIETHLVDMAAHPLSTMLDTEFGEIVAEKLAASGIKWQGSATLQEFAGKESVSEVILANGSSIKLNAGKDFVIVSAGVKPELELFRGSAIEIVKDGIVVNDRMQTNVPDVYAAGDCVHFKSSIDGQPLGGKLATNAVPMAKVAARNLLGKEATYKGFINGAATCVGDLRVGGTGFTESFAKTRGFSTVCGFGQTTSRFPIMPGAKKVQVKLVAYARTGRLLGGQIIGPEAVAERIDVISLALQHKMHLSDLAELSYSAQPWQTFYPAANPIVMAAEEALKKM
ncbi:MAG: CoA-disulfide reductase [Candidatus Rifleibacterium amylolyticum]|nr:MAG: CoA-disulfide reductase [Candidatus Rifleibacterium amylolyticum]